MCSDIMQDVWICHWPMIQNSNWLFDDADNCEDYPVTTNQLKDLKYACQRVVDNPDLAEELLPTYVGFFGLCDYDDRYFNRVSGTISILDGLLEKDCDSDEYYYHAWW